MYVHGDAAFGDLDAFDVEGYFWHIYCNCVFSDGEFELFWFHDWNSSVDERKDFFFGCCEFFVYGDVVDEGSSC